MQTYNRVVRSGHLPPRLARIGQGNKDSRGKALEESARGGGRSTAACGGCDGELGVDTILAVDDSRTIRDLIDFVLTGAGYRTVTAVDGADGLEKLKALKPDLVITDLNMPKMNGYDFIRNARAAPTTAAVPILVLTTEADDITKAKVRELGANGWIAKPFNPTQLLDTVKRVSPPKAA